jgi:hypothetical protein
MGSFLCFSNVVKLRYHKDGVERSEEVRQATGSFVQNFMFNNEKSLCNFDLLLRLLKFYGNLGYVWLLGLFQLGYLFQPGQPKPV